MRFTPHIPHRQLGLNGHGIATHGKKPIQNQIQPLGLEWNLPEMKLVVCVELCPTDFFATYYPFHPFLEPGGFMSGFWPFGGGRGGGGGQAAHNKLRKVPVKVEPKVFFANGEQGRRGGCGWCGVWTSMVWTAARTGLTDRLTD